MGILYTIIAFSDMLEIDCTKTWQGRTAAPVLIQVPACNYTQQLLKIIVLKSDISMYFKLHGNQHSYVDLTQLLSVQLII